MPERAMSPADVELCELIGTGRAGAVWSAVGPDRSHACLAVRRCRARPGAVVALSAQASELAALAEPGLLDVVVVLDDPGAPAGRAEPGDGVAMVMELGAGGSLRDLLDERRRLPPGEVVALIAPVAAALAAAHRRGIVHGDVKPADVILAADGAPRLGDFGCVRHLLGVDGRPLGPTPGYADPAASPGADPAPAGDVHALGVVAFEALWGARPDTAAPERSAEGAGSAALEAVIAAALVPDPALRPSAGAWAVALLGAVEAPTVVLPGTARRRDDACEPWSGTTTANGAAARPFGPRPPERADAHRSRRRRPAPAVVAAVLVGSVVAVVAALAVRAAEVDEPPGPPAAVEPAGADRCPRYPGLSRGPGEVALSGDLDGDGCAVPVVWDGRALHLRIDPSAPEPAVVGFSDDAGRPLQGQLLLGDWDCDGTDAPALYLPATGEVVTFDRLALPGEEVRRRARPTGVPVGAARIGRGPDGCDAVEVTATG